MHLEAKEFLEYVKTIFPEYFINKNILDVGCGDINGNNRYLFENCNYTGNDVFKTKNVTIVSKTKDLPFDDCTFDTIISSECFEHDPEFKESILKIYDLLKDGGLFAFTCAGDGRAEHGTRRTTPKDSYGTIAEIEDMQDYYKNINENDLNNVINLNNHFDYFKCYYRHTPSPCDFYFVGIKKSLCKNNFSINDFISKNIIDKTNNI